MDLLITGGTGFVGTHLLRAWGGAHHVYALTRRVPAPPAEVTWIECDLTQALPIDQLPPRVDMVMYLAQSRRDRDLVDGARDVFAVNVHATFNLLEYARGHGVKRFILASSGGVYGTGPHPFRETDSLKPPNFYLTSKQCAESLAASYEGFFTLVILRPFFIYGPDQSGRLIPDLAARIAKGEEIHVAGSEGPRLNPVYVDDVVNALGTLLRSDLGGTYNVAGPEVVSVRQLAEMIGAAVGSRPRFHTAAGASAGDIVADIDRLHQLGWVPRVRLEEGLRRALGCGAARPQRPARM